MLNYSIGFGLKLNPKWARFFEYTWVLRNYMYAYLEFIGQGTFLKVILSNNRGILVSWIMRTACIWSVHIITVSFAIAQLRLWLACSSPKLSNSHRNRFLKGWKSFHNPAARQRMELQKGILWCLIQYRDSGLIHGSDESNSHAEQVGQEMY